jgi:hypothetical protein
MVWRRLVNARLSNSTVGVPRVLSMLLEVRAPTIPPIAPTILFTLPKFLFWSDMTYDIYGDIYTTETTPHAYSPEMQA